jgi:uncharacterized protein (DUF1015 family)
MPIGSDNGNERYVSARALLESWITTGVLVRDPSPSFSLYRMQFRDSLGRDRTTVGVIGALEVVDEGAGGVLPHERTTPKAKTDRLELTRATSCNLSPVWGLSLASGLSEVLMQEGEPMGSYTDDLGVRHTAERVTDPRRIEQIAKAVSAQPVVIADGHHRYAISRTYRDEIRSTTGRRDSDAEMTMTYVNELVDDQLSVAAIHRVYRDISAPDLTAALDRSFDIEDSGIVGSGVLAEMERRNALFLMLPNGTGAWLTPRSEAFLGVRNLDSARLEHALAGVHHVVDYQHGFEEVRQALTDGSHSAAVFIRPVSVSEIRRTAYEKLLMPPKSTFFTPKLQTGLVMRELG